MVANIIKKVYQLTCTTGNRVYEMIKTRVIPLVAEIHKKINYFLKADDQLVGKFCLYTILSCSLKKNNFSRGVILFLLCTACNFIFADGDTVTKAENDDDLTPAKNYINPGAYNQNPYINMPSLGGTQYVAESAKLNQNFAEKLFADGTWNVMGDASYVNSQYISNFGYGTNIFAQTGQVGGFSFGGLFTFMNPFGTNTSYNPTQSNTVQILPVNQQITPQELFAEYQYKNIVQVDAGYIGINNSPWLTYYQNNVLNVVTYQGATINVHPLHGWLFTALAFNGSQLTGENGFSQQTLYNNTFDYGTGTANVVNEGSNGTIALGAAYTNQANNFGFRLWAYQFSNYANLLYIDSNLKITASQDLSFTIAAQGAMEGGTYNNVFYNTGYNEVQSNMVGLQLSMKYSWFGLQLGYNNIWGPNNAYAGGDMVSPYTYQYASDPLYTTSWMQGMIEKSAGSAYKIAIPLTFLDNNLTISPSYAYYDTNLYPISAEYDLTMSYSIPQVKGFTIFSGLGYQSTFSQTVGNIYSAQIMFSYLY
jgi:hypothetical protein